MKRVGFGDLYSETVKDEVTGKLLHHCGEPFSKHIERGSAKNRNVAPASAKPRPFSATAAGAERPTGLIEKVIRASHRRAGVAS
jgi:hypothetical protein